MKAAKGGKTADPADLASLLLLLSTDNTNADPHNNSTTAPPSAAGTSGHNQSNHHPTTTNGNGSASVNPLLQTIQKNLSLFNASTTSHNTNNTNNNNNAGGGSGGGNLNITSDNYHNHIYYLDVDGPVDPATTLIRYDTPFVPGDLKQSLQLRRKLHLPSPAEVLYNSTKGGTTLQQTQNQQQQQNLLSSTAGAGGTYNAANSVLNLSKSSKAMSLAAGTTTGAGGTKGKTQTGGSSKKNGGEEKANNTVISIEDRNIRILLDSFITPRRWRDATTGTIWVQHASPFPSSRTEAQQTHTALLHKLSLFTGQQFHKRNTAGGSPGAPQGGNDAMMESLHSAGGINGIRTVLLAECFLEVLRQVVVESWERGLLLLSIHTDRVCAQAAHRQMFETRVGHAFRLALLGEKESAHLTEGITALRARVAELQQEEEKLRQQCDAFAGEAETRMLIAEKEHNEALLKLRKEGITKRHQLETMVAVPPPQ